MEIQKFSVTGLDRGVTDEIVAKIKEIGASDSGSKELSLELNSTTGEVPFAYEILQAINTTDVHLVTHSTGTLSVAGTLLAAAGQPKKRTAEVSTVFKLNDASTPGKSKRVSNPNSDFLFMVLSELSGKKSPIKKTLATKDSITSFEAKKLNLIDSSSEFKSKYELLKTKENKKEGEQSAA